MQEKKEGLYLKDDEVIICSNCYAENKKGETYCYNCGSRLYYNTSDELEVIDEENDIIFYNEDNFDTSIKFDKYIMAVDKDDKQLQFFYKLKLDKIIEFKNIVECKIVENSNVIESGGIGRAIIGGVIAGRSRSYCRCKYTKK